MSALVPAEIDSIAGGYHGDPFSILGPHQTDAGWEVRAFLPHASVASVMTLEGSVPMRRLHDEGFFVAEMPQQPTTYMLNVTRKTGEAELTEDPYRFPARITSFDLHLFGEGSHQSAHHFLGAHAIEWEGVNGVQFAVWAPNANVVLVTGNFNDWDMRALPMRRRDGGVWELFVPGVKPGAIYKYFIHSSMNGYTVLKADPYAFAAELPPATGSIVAAPDRFEWRDDSWINRRTATNWHAAPMSLYEVHLGSWLRNTREDRELSYRELAAFVRQLESGRLELPPGCEVNYDLRLIEFLKSLGAGDPENEYHELRATIGRRPTMLEFYNYDESLDRGRRMERMLRIRQKYGSWAELLRSMDDLNGLDTYSAFLRELETTPMVKCFKMVLLEAFQELDGWSEGPTLPQLAARSWEILRRRRSLLADLPEEQNQSMDGDSSDWRAYWRRNPVQAWIGGNRPNSTSYFRIADGCFVAAFAASMAEREEFVSLVQEIVDYRLASYEARREEGPRSTGIVSIDDANHRRVRLPYFPSLQIACGHFKTGSHEVVEYLLVSASLGSLHQDRHFVARASGNSMNYGRNPVQDGDYLLMEHVTPTSAGSITGSVMAVETQDQAGDNQYLLRVVQKRHDGGYVLQAKNPKYSPIEVTGQEFRTLARLKSVLRPEDVSIDGPKQE